MPYAALNGLRLYYEEQGTGPPLVLLNGATGTIDESWGGGWATLRMSLAQRYRVVQVEHRGHGRADNPGGGDAYTYGTLAADAATLIEHLGLAPAHVAGFSEGGVVGLELALSHPAAVRSVVGIGVNYTNDARTIATLGQLDPGRLEQEAPEFAADLARRHDTHHTPGYWRDLVRWIVAENTRAPAYTVEDLHRVTVPTLWVAGENDPWFELDQVLAMKRHVPDAEILIVNQARHGPQMTHPHLVGPAIADFLTRVDERQRR